MFRRIFNAPSPPPPGNRGQSREATLCTGTSRVIETREDPNGVTRFFVFSRVPLSSRESNERRARQMEFPLSFTFLRFARNTVS